jgi:hypothetical protein
MRRVPLPSLDGALTVHEGIAECPQAKGRQNAQANGQWLSALDCAGNRASSKDNGRQ